MLVSEGAFVGSGDLRQMSEYPIPHGQLSFLHPEEIEACIPEP
jgi:hypothetical protein